VPSPERIPNSVFASKKDRFTIVTLVAAFVVIEALLLSFMDHSCLVPGSDCARETDRYGAVIANSLLTEGGLVDAEDASQPFTEHPPGYGILMAGTFFVFGVGTYIPVVLIQLVMLLAVGFFVRYAVNTTLPGYGTLAMALVLFNPNVLAHVNLPHTVAVELFFLTAAFAAAVRYHQSALVRWAIVCGGVIGIATMVRASAQLILFSIPFVFVFLELTDPLRRLLWRKTLLASAGASLAAFLVVAPWVFHQNAAGEGFRISSAGLEGLLLEDSLRYLTPGFGARFDPDAESKFRAFEETTLQTQYPDWASKSIVERGLIRRSFVVDYYLSFPFRTSEFFLALVKSWGTFLAGGGEGMAHRLLGMEFQPEKSPTVFYTTKGFAVGFAIVLRLVGIIGVIAMIMRGHYALLLLTVGLVTVYVLGPFLVGQPRYRVPVEPELAIFAVYGIVFLRAYLGPRQIPLASSDGGRTRTQLADSPK